MPPKPEHPLAELPSVIDLEASGFGRGSYPIEVGYVRSDGEAQCYLIRPRPHWTHWDPEAEVLHGIDRTILERFGREPDDVASTLNQALAGSTVYSDAWGNDRTWLALLFDEANLVQQFKLDTLRALLTEDEAERWSETKADVLESLNLDRHRASSDALVLQLTYRRLRTGQ